MDNIDGLQGEVMHKSEKGRVGELERERERKREGFSGGTTLG